MILLGICPGCHGRKFPEDRPHRSLVLKKRKYYTKHAGIIIGKKETCKRCDRNTKKALGEEYLSKRDYEKRQLHKLV